MDVRWAGTACCGSGAVSRRGRPVVDSSAPFVKNWLLCRESPIYRLPGDNSRRIGPLLTRADRYIGATRQGNRLASDIADRSANYGVGAGVADGDAEPDPEADPDAEGASDPVAEADGEDDGDGDGESDAAGMEGSGIGVGSGTKLDGTPRIDSTMTSARMAKTVRIHGRARRSLRVGRAPR